MKGFSNPTELNIDYFLKEIYILYYFDLSSLPTYFVFILGWVKERQKIFLCFTYNNQVLGFLYK